MCDRFGWLWARVCRRAFAGLSVREERVADLLMAAGRGPVVYVTPSLSALNYLIFNHLFIQHGLPLARFGQGLAWLPWLPLLHQLRVLWAWLGRLFGRGGPAPEQVMRDLLHDGDAALIFLRTPDIWDRRLLRLVYGLRDRVLGWFGRRSGAGGERGDPLVELVRLQRTLSSPIQLCPQILVWTRAPPSQRKSFWDAFFGETESPGLLRELYQFLRNRRASTLRGGAPLSLAELIAERPELDDHSQAKRVRGILEDRLQRHHRVVTGPAGIRADDTIPQVLDSPRVQAALQAEADERGGTPDGARARAYRILRRMAADVHVSSLRWLNWFLSFVWRRLYRGVDVDSAGLETVREAALRGPLVLVPSHKSHVDYLLISQVFWWHDLSVPLIVAGDNLALPVVGWIFRRCGAFFLRRSFKGDHLYGALLAEYVRRVLQDGHHVEFFIEGGRTRTGKVREPRMGLLAMVCDALLDGHVPDLSFVPISVGYERVIEAESYTSEQVGAPKTKESLRGVIRSRRVLRTRFGRVNVQFAEPLSFRDYLSGWTERRTAAGAGADPVLDPADRRDLVAQLAYRLVSDINTATLATAPALVSTALLTHPRRGLYATELYASVERLAEDLEASGARVVSLHNVADKVQATLGLLGRLVRHHRGRFEEVIRPRNSRRLELAFYKNTLIHVFVARALVATGLMAHADAGPRGMGVDRVALTADAKFLSWLFKREFVYQQTPGFQLNFDAALRRLEQDELVASCGPETWRRTLSGDLTLRLYVSLLRPYLDAYWAVCHTLVSHGVTTPLTAKDLTADLGERLETLYQAGHLQWSESCSHDTVANVLKLLADGGYVVKTPAASKRGPLLSLEAGPGGAAYGSLATIAARLAALRAGLTDAGHDR